MNIWSKFNRHYDDLRQSRRDQMIYNRIRSVEFGWKAEDARVILSESRGGSTWLFETMLRSNKMVSQWEPLHPVKGTVSVLRTNYGDRPYLAPDEQDEALADCLSATLSGKSWTPWTARYNKPDVIPAAEFLLVKFVRANMLAPWMLGHMHLRYKPVMLIRHPVAVALSQLDAFRGAGRNGDFFKIPDCHNNHRYEQHLDYLQSLSGALEIKVALWCINNLPVLQDEKFMQQVLPVFYEELVLDPERHFEQILVNWNIASFPLEQVRASSTTGRGGVEKEPMAQISKWQGKISLEQKENCRSVLQYFGCDFYSVDEPLPIK